jgi:hypothetical protein
LAGILLIIVGMEMGESTYQIMRELELGLDGDYGIG